MGEHATALQLDTLAAGLPLDAAVPAHIAGCAACQAKLDAVKAERAAVERSPQFEATLKKLQPPAEPAPRRRPLGLALAIAAVLLLLVVGGRFLFPRDDGTILKGGPTVELLKDGAPVTQAKVGDRLTLAVGAAGASTVAVYARDRKGRVDVLIRPQPVEPGTRVPVGNVLEVTAGSIDVFACFGPTRQDVAAMKTQLDFCAKTRLEVVP